MIMSPEVKLTLWRILDGFICIFILAPLVVFYWRGSFQLLDIFTYPSSLEISSWINIAIGVLGTVMVNLSQNVLHKTVDGIKSTALQIICKRFYTYIYGWIIVNHWRGIWRLWDAYTGTAFWSGVASMLIGCFLLIGMKSFRNVVAPPLVTVSDFDKNYFIIKTRFRTKAKKSWNYLADNLFSVAIPGSLVVSVWRGQWAVLDHFLAADSLTISYLISGGIGFGLTVILFFMQWPASWVSKAAERQQPAWSNAICHLIGAFGTMILLHGNSVLVRDVQIDGELKDGRGLFFFSKSLTLFEERSGLFPSTVMSPTDMKDKLADANLSPVIIVVSSDKADSLDATSTPAQTEETQRILQHTL
ncbi:hypothetical protein BV898_10346 [Hypsibius exemplaris]|uniref:Uncharacterized protein n=1 Tax=Hypsibius exemplaris TaxID=2072580 RepID=A0A1W0WK24_HYPEX|nr:hypothetical protein BV898_10346 [Hypsibius exemplaris]